jgi:hypothetical protein
MECGTLSISHLFIIPLAEAGEFVSNALTGGFGFFFFECDVMGLAADEIQLEPGAFFGLWGKQFAGDVEALIIVSEDEDDQVAFKSINHGFHHLTSL